MDRFVYSEIGRQIRRARERLGLSQTELARRLGYSSAATISHFEGGERRVSIAELQRIAAEFGLPLSYFLDSSVTQSRSHRIEFRAQEVRPAARAAVAAFLTFTRMNGSSNARALPEIAVARPGKAAEHVLRIAESTTPPVMPREVARSLDVPVFDWAFPDEISGIFAQEGEAVAIGVNEVHPHARQRFTIAHELGHFIFAGGRDLFVDFAEADAGARYDDVRQHASETKANQFAADLLMPQRWIREDVAQLGLDVTVLAKRYEVSEQALWFRLLALKFVQAADDVTGSV